MFQHGHVPTCSVPSPTNQECDGACLKDGDRGASDDTDLAAMRHVSCVASVENFRSRYAKVRLEHMYTLCRVQCMRECICRSSGRFLASTQAHNRVQHEALELLSLFCRTCEFQGSDCVFRTLLGAKTTAQR